jgi:hypothetical protein
VQVRYANTESTVLQLHLDDGETFMAYHGSQSIFVPVTDESHEYNLLKALIEAENLTVGAYQEPAAPTAPPPVPDAAAPATEAPPAIPPAPQA